MLTHIVRHIFRTARPIRISNFLHGWRTTTSISHRRHDLQGQRSRSQGHVISLSRLGLMLYLCHQRPAGAYRIGRTRRKHFLLTFICVTVIRNITLPEQMYVHLRQPFIITRARYRSKRVRERSRALFELTRAVESAPARALLNRTRPWCADVTSESL